MSTIGLFTDPLISPLDDAQSALASLVGLQRDAQDALRGFVDDLTEAGGPTDRIAGVAADALRQAAEHLMQMSESRLAILDELSAAMHGCAKEAAWAVDTVYGAPLDEALLERLLTSLQLQAVLADGEHAVQLAVSQLKQTLAAERASAPPDAGAVALDELLRVMREWGGLIYSAAQRLQGSIRTSQEAWSSLGRLTDPIDNLFHTPDLTASRDAGGMGPLSMPAGAGSSGATAHAAAQSAGAPIAGDRLLPLRIHRQSEFVHGLTGDCGPDALDEAEAWADQRDSTADTVYGTVTRLQAWGGCGPNGNATSSALAQQARLDGFIVEELPFQEPMMETTWQSFFDRHVGKHAIVYETGHGAALRDWKTGKGENAGPDLRYHSVMIAGRHVNGGAGDPMPSGWWCADGDNYDLGDVLQFYPDDVMAASQPVAALAVWPRAAAAVAAVLAGQFGGGDIGSA
jgi:hypothetical protein